MKIEIFGAGCVKCKILAENTLKAVEEAGLEAEVIKVTEMEEMVKMGIMMTPALVVDGEIKSAGRALTKDQIITILNSDSDKSSCSSCCCSNNSSCC